MSGRTPDVQSFITHPVFQHNDPDYIYIVCCHVVYIYIHTQLYESVFYLHLQTEQIPFRHVSMIAKTINTCLYCT